MKREREIFKKGSTTYYFSSKFFPRTVRDDVFRLYSFVRVADDYVDQQPPDKKGYKDLLQQYQYVLSRSAVPRVKQTDSINKRAAKNMVAVSKRYDFNMQWIEAFLDAMEADLKKKKYKTLKDSLQYVHGSAEVIGLMMSKIMGLPDDSVRFATMQGRAMQWINFIRDIKEDNGLGRCYFPQSDLKKFGLKDLSEETVQKDPEAFRDFMQFQIKRYDEWQSIAREGFRFIPKRQLVALKTAVDMYDWTARQIAAKPMIVFEKKVKPTKQRVLKTAARNTVRG